MACAALGAGAGYCRAKVDALGGVRHMVLGQFARIATVCDVPRPDGAFYCLVRVKTGMDSVTLASRLIAEHRVAAVPGSAFGLADGCYLRVSYGALDPGTVAEGMTRLVNGLDAIVGRN